MLQPLGASVHLLWVLYKRAFWCVPIQVLFLEEPVAQLARKMISWILIHALPRSSNDFQLSLFHLQHPEVVVEVTHSCNFVHIDSFLHCCSASFAKFLLFLPLLHGLGRSGDQALCTLFRKRHSYCACRTHVFRLSHFLPRCTLPEKKVMN